MSGENVTIIKRKKVIAGDGHHGGAWKVAYADFVTAMMAFFLMMWLLSSTSEEQRKGLADFFSPRVPLAETSGGGEALFSGETVFSTERLITDGVGGKTDDREGEKVEDPTGADGTAPHQAEEAPEKPAEDETPSLAEAMAALEQAKEQVEQALNTFQESAADNALLEHVSLRITPEGLVIEIADVAGQPLFDRGSAEPSEKLTRLVEMVAPIVDYFMTGSEAKKFFLVGSDYAFGRGMLEFTRAYIEGLGGEVVAEEY
ncbi:MAG: flagellar motor protein MotB, partial [Pseudomonadota bacterium]